MTLTFNYTNHRGERATRRVLPFEISRHNSAYHGPMAWLLVAHDLDRGARREFALDDITSFGPFNEARERDRFETAMYAHYLRTRAARLAKQQAIAFDDPDQERPKAELFMRQPNGDYVAIIYQAAWGGWKAARGFE